MTHPERDRDPTAGGALPSRRDFLTLGMGAFVVAALPLAARRRPRLVRRTVPVMGTVATLVAVHRDERYAHAALTAAATELLRVESVLTRFRADSEIGRINAGDARSAVPVSAETAGVLAAALRWAEATGGAFDPALARATALWDVTRRTEPPALPEFARLAARRLYRGLELGTSHGTQHVVVRADDDVAIDLGGIGKGYGVDRATEVLRTWGIGSALVNAGGDLYALGTAPDGEPWRVGVRSPADPTRLAATLRASDSAIATSGDYEQYFEHAGRRYHHLLDPATASPRIGETHTVTVRAPDCMNADAAATALFGTPADAARALLAALRPDAAIEYIG
jgi:FAD:protein FMN transferase